MAIAGATPTWAELAPRVPAALRPYVLEFAWDRERLWALDLPVETTHVRDLVWQLELPWWRDGDRYFALAPLEAAADPLRHAEQHARTLAADPAYPPVVTRRAGRDVVLDGLHRLLKALIEGRETVRVRRLAPERLLQVAEPGAVEHDLDFVRSALALLAAAGVECAVYGGWAAELLGLAPPRPHRDVDLLHRADTFGAVDRALRSLQLEEVRAKRFAHKRAFVLAGVLVELFLVRRDGRGPYTLLDGGGRHAWPSRLTCRRGGLEVASAAALARTFAHPAPA